MIGRGRARGWAIAGAVAASVATLGADRVDAFGTPTYVIYVSGPNYGTIETSGGALPLPEGACGMRMTSDVVLAWYWAEGYAFPIGVLPVENNGWMPPPGGLEVLIEFTGGGFGEGCAEEAVYHVPAAVNSEPPPGAVALVVQVVSPDDVEFLDESFHVFEPPEPPDFPDPPDPGDICSLAPLFCELSDLLKPCDLSFVNGDLESVCEDAGSQARVALGVGDFLQPIVPDVGGVHDPFDTVALERAGQRAAKGLEFLAVLERGRDELVRSTKDRIRNPLSIRSLSRLSTATDLSALDLGHCHDAIERGLRFARSGLSVRSRAAVAEETRRAVLTCSAATRTLSDAQDEATRLTIGLMNER
jgi:hypothetical protein